jgi:SAM-dependent methyltransferase
MQSWKREPQLETLAPPLHQWYQAELGRAVLGTEQRLLARGLTDCFGYHLLQLSVDNSLTLFRDCRVQRCFKAGPVRAPLAPGDAFVQCNFHELPFESDSLDVVIVHHVLEFATHPHALLRELYRVIVPHGRILLVGFNPWSLFGVRMLLGHWRRDSIWHNHLLSAPRVSDWLQVLGFEVEQTDFGFHRLPVNRIGLCGSGEAGDTWSRYLPSGGIYLITALKQVATFIPMKPRWVRPAAVLSPLAKPSASIGQSSVKQR